MKYAPVVLTVYNRPSHTQQVLEALVKNDLAKDTDLFVYSDGPRNPEDEMKVAQVRKVLREADGFKKVTVVESKENKGLAKSVIGAVTEIVNEYGNVIVLEDDLLTQRYFLNVMNQMLEFYEEDSRVASVSAFRQSHRLVPTNEDQRKDIFFNVRPTSTGWGTWKSRWMDVDWDVSQFEDFIQDKSAQKRFNLGGKDLSTMLARQVEGKIDSWAIRWSYHCFINDLVSVNTSLSYLDNIGHDDSGANSKDESYFFQQVKMAEKRTLDLVPYDGTIDYKLLKKYYQYTSFGWTYLKRKLYTKLGILLE